MDCILQPDKPNPQGKKRQLDEDPDSDYEYEEYYQEKKPRGGKPAKSGISEEEKEKILQMVENEPDVSSCI